MKDFAKREPVVISMLVSSLLGWLASFLVVHGILTKTQASSLVQEILPTAVAVALAGVGFVVRRWVSPAASKVEQSVPWIAPGSPAGDSLAEALAILSAPVRGSLGTPGQTIPVGSVSQVPPGTPNSPGGLQ